MSKSFVLVVALCAVPCATLAQNRAQTGTVVIAHGGDSLWNAQVIDAAKAARTGGPVEVSFLMGPAAKASPVQEIVARLERLGVSKIVFVPLLVSSYSGHYEQIRYLAGGPVALDEKMLHHLQMAGIERPHSSVPIHVTSALDDAPHVARVLTDRALALANGSRGRAVLILGHGPNSAEDYAAWMTSLRTVADSVRLRGGFRDVRVELLRDDAPAPVRAEAVQRARELIDLQHRATGRDVLVVPVLIAKGAISRDKIPHDLAGLPIVYSGEPLLPHIEIVRWIEQSVNERSR